MDTPVQPFEHHLPQTVAISSGPRPVARRTIALDAEEISAGTVGIEHRKVDKEPGASNLRVNSETAAPERR